MAARRFLFGPRGKSFTEEKRAAFFVGLLLFLGGLLEETLMFFEMIN